MNTRTLLFSMLVILGMIALPACGGVKVPAVGATVTEAPKVSSPTQSPPVQSANPAGASSDLLAAYQGTLEEIYTKVSPSVVNIRVVQKISPSNSAFPEIPGFPFFELPQGKAPQQQYQSALGSGFVWDQDGHIVTNNHVISGADKIEVAFSDGTILPAQVIGTDPDSDLAVLKVEAPASALLPVTMGDSTVVKVGELAIAIGNPFGLEGTMTAGIISAVGRSLPADENSTQSYTIPDVIQTDAPVNPGNSGGVLVDTQGQVLGVTSAIESPVRASAGIGFAIPAAIVKNVVPALITDGRYIHTWLGISGTSLIPELATAMKLDASQRGALIEEILPNSPAENAGLRGSSSQVTLDGQTINVGGDVITKIDDQTVAGIEDVIAYLARNTKVGQKVTLTILRDGNQETVEVSLAARPAAKGGANSRVITRGIRLGISGITVDEAIVKAMQLPGNLRGVLVEEVQPGSLAETAGLKGGSKTITLDGQQVLAGGDIISGLNGQPIASMLELKAALAQLPSDENLTLTVLRDGSEIEITVQPGQ